MTMAKKETVRIECCCAVCGSTDVEYAAWYSPNTGEVGEAFGTWNYGDNTYCRDCDDNSPLVDRSAEPEAFATARKQQRKKRSV